MKPDFILDASAILAFLQGEQGADSVAATFRRGAVSSVNYAEVVSKLADRGASEAQIRIVLGRLALSVIDFDADAALETGLLRTETKALGLSLGDRACLALARREKAVAVTADRDWAKLDVGVGVDVIR